MDNIDDIIKEAMKGGNDIVLGDKIDNRGGTIIKNIEHYHAVNSEVTPDYNQKDSSGEQPLPIEVADVIPLNQLPAAELSRLERIDRGIRLVHDSGIIQNNYEYVAVLYIILEKNILPSLTYADHERLLNETGLFDENSLPKANNMKAYIVRGKFPDWVVDGKKYEVTRQFVAVARKFLEGYGK